MEAYIYTYVNKETKKTYIGARYAYKGSCYDDFNIKYFSSSKDKQFRQDMTDGKLEGQIILVINDKDAKKKIFEIETKMIIAYWNKYGKKNSYNHYANNNWNYNSCTASEETKHKLRILHLGQIPWNKGKTFSEEAKLKMSASHKGKHLSDETKLKISLYEKEHRKGSGNPMFGRKKQKYNWLTEDGTIKTMDLGNAHRNHPLWINIGKSDNFETENRTTL